MRRRVANEGWRGVFGAVLRVSCPRPAGLTAATAVGRPWLVEPASLTGGAAALCTLPSALSRACQAAAALQACRLHWAMMPASRVISRSAPYMYTRYLRALSLLHLSASRTTLLL